MLVFEAPQNIWRAAPLDKVFSMKALLSSTALTDLLLVAPFAAAAPGGQQIAGQGADREPDDAEQDEPFHAVHLARPPVLKFCGSV